MAQKECPQCHALIPVGFPFHQCNGNGTAHKRRKKRKKAVNYVAENLVDSPEYLGRFERPEKGET